VTVQIDNYPLRRFFIKPCPFIYFEQMLLLMLSKETGEWCTKITHFILNLAPEKEKSSKKFGISEKNAYLCKLKGNRFLPLK